MGTIPGQRSELWGFIAENASFGDFLNQHVEVIDELPHLHAKIDEIGCGRHGIGKDLKFFPVAIHEKPQRALPENIQSFKEF